jgi:hypothetical protein
VLLEAARRPATQAAPALTVQRGGQLLSFFAFAPKDGWPLSAVGALYGLLALCGLVLALRSKGARFVAVWAVAGFAAIESLAQIHPHFYGGRLSLPAGVAIPILAALPIAALLERRVLRVVGAALLAGCLYLSARGLSVYFREGRADWRTLARFLQRQAAPSERIFTENQYAQLCLAYYLVGPDWLYQAMEKAGTPERDIANLEGEAVRLSWAWKPGERAWLVLAGQPPMEELRRRTESLPAIAFPKAEGAVLHRLDPERREEVLAPR